MVDYDVMVFVRCKPTLCFIQPIDILDRDNDKAILICANSWYQRMRAYLINDGSDVVHEIQLIKPKGVKYNKKTKTFSHHTLYQ